MQTRNKIGFLAAFLALALGLAAPAALAQDTSAVPAVSVAPSKPAATPVNRYFIEFRSRSALSYGHTFLVHGKLNAQGQVGPVTAAQVVGFHPFSESSIPWSIGHVVPVPAEHGFSDGDTEDEYITARYRVLLTEAEYNDTMAFIHDLAQRTPVWHAVLYNCAAYVGDIAKHMGLKVPTPLQYPDNFIKELAALNGGKAWTLEDTVAAKPAATKPVSTAAKPAAAKPVAAAAKPAAAKPAAGKPAAAPKPAIDPSAPSAANPAAPKPAAAAKPAAAKRTAAAVGAAQPTTVRQ